MKKINLSKNLQIIMKIKTKSNFYSDGSYGLTKSVKTHVHFGESIR